MLLCTIFLTMLLTSFYGFSSIDAGIWSDEANENKFRQRRGYTTAEDLSTLEREFGFMRHTLDSIKNTINAVQDKLTTFTDKQKQPAPNWNEKLQAFERKLDLLQRSQEEQESYSNKLTALEFTLNHVLSKVVYLSDNIPARTDNVDTTKQRESSAKTTDIEILARLNDLLRHVQSIKRESCRRSTLPAAAGPVAAIGTEKHNKLLPSSGITTGNTTLFAEELAKKIVHRLNKDIFTAIQELPAVAKRHDEQFSNVLDVVKRIDKQLELWSSEDLHQQNWQRMLQYCQDVSDEFSSFAGNSDALLKRIESFVRDMAHKVGDLPTRRINLSATCAGRKNSTVSDERSTNTSTTAGFDSNNVVAVPNAGGCHELPDDSHTDGIYRFSTPEVNSAGRDFNTRYCVFATDERAWTVIQRRGPYDIQENFNRSWADYRNGFGNMSKDFWFGNEFIHRLTSYNNYELLVELENFENGKMSISYGSFGLDWERNNYSLYIGDYKGPGPDSLSYHCFMDFSTYDRNNKEDDSCCACAVGYGSGWWFDNCLESNLNGFYRNEPLNHSYVGIIWEHWLGDYSLKASRMLVRPKNWTVIGNDDKSGKQWLDIP